MPRVLLVKSTGLVKIFLEVFMSTLPFKTSTPWPLLYFSVFVLHLPLCMAVIPILCLHVPLLFSILVETIITIMIIIVIANSKEPIIVLDP